MGATSRHGWPLPDDTDRVAQGAAAIRALGEAIDTDFGGDVAAAGSLNYWRLGPIAGCHFTVGGQPGQSVSGTLPADARPDGDVPGVAFIYTSSGTPQANSAVPFRVRANGGVFIDAPAGLSTPSGGTIRGSAVWAVA